MLIQIFIYCIFLFVTGAFLWPGSSSSGTVVEMTAMADCMPFYGVSDLEEILTAVKDRNAQTLQQCRPLKVTHYLQVGYFLLFTSNHQTPTTTSCPPSLFILFILFLFTVKLLLFFLSFCFISGTFLSFFLSFLLYISVALISLGFPSSIFFFLSLHLFIALFILQYSSFIPFFVSL